MTNTVSRLRWMHVWVSVILISVVMYLVFGFWFPHPYDKVSKGKDLAFMIAGVDVICGPVLCLFLIRREKSKKDNITDSGLILLIQMMAFVYGIHALSYARPLAIVHEVDRYQVISYADIELSGVGVVDILPLSFSEIKQYGIKPTTSAEDKLDRLTKSLGGLESSQQPHLWSSYEENRTALLSRANGIDMLKKSHPLDQLLIDAELAKIKSSNETHAINTDHVLWMPLVSRHTSDWIILLDPQTAKPIGFVNVDGFVQ